MITLTIEEDRVLENGQVISDITLFLKQLPKHEEVAIVVKTCDISYHHSPLRKAVQFMKSAEFSIEHWIGEKVITTHKLRHKYTLIGGVFPTHFMRDVIHQISSFPLALKGIFIWADLILEAFKPLPSGWAILWHEGNFIVCHDSILKFSRKCYVQVDQELLKTMRYIKRFGYISEEPITLITTAHYEGFLPSFMTQEVRCFDGFKYWGLNVHLSQLQVQQRLYAWPRKIRATAYTIAFLNIIAIAVLSWQLTDGISQEYLLTNKIALMPIKSFISEKKLDAFSDYLHFSKDHLSLLHLIRQLMPLLQDDAVATHLHWTHHSLELQLELNATVTADHLLLNLRSQFNEYYLTWHPENKEPMKGILRLEVKGFKNEKSDI